MKLKLSDAQLEQLKEYINNSSDSEMLTAREAVIDLYDVANPISMNFVFVKGGIGIDGAAELLYSEEENGYYMGDRIEDSQAIHDALLEAGAISE